MGAAGSGGQVHGDALSWPLIAWTALARASILPAGVHVCKSTRHSCERRIWWRFPLANQQSSTASNTEYFRGRSSVLGLKRLDAWKERPPARPRKGRTDEAGRAAARPNPMEGRCGVQVQVPGRCGQYDRHTQHSTAHADDVRCKTTYCTACNPTPASSAAHRKSKSGHRHPSVPLSVDPHTADARGRDRGVVIRWVAYRYTPYAFVCLSGRQRPPCLAPVSISTYEQGRTSSAGVLCPVRPG